MEFERKPTLAPPTPHHQWLFSDDLLNLQSAHNNTFYANWMTLCIIFGHWTRQIHSGRMGDRDDSHKCIVVVN